jgi:hypothetical protein
MLAPQNISDGAAIQNVKVPVEGNGDAATAAPGSGIIVLSDPIRTAPVIFYIKATVVVSVRPSVLLTGQGRSGGVCPSVCLNYRAGQEWWCLSVCVIVALMRCGGLTREDVSKKLLCFGANGAFIFQGGETNVTREIKDFWAPFSMGVHCEAHRTNLVIKSLSNLTFFSRLDMFMTNLHSPKCHLKF